MPSVSVIIPFYNTPLRFLADAIESVLAQSYDDWELFLVDDGSDDEHSAGARSLLAGRDSRLCYLTHPGHVNLGMSAARNLGVHHAQGRYVAFLDSDDVWLPHKLTEQVPVLETYTEVAMLYGKTLHWHSWSGNTVIRDYLPPLGVPANRLFAPPTLLPKFLRGTASVPCTCSALLRREALEKVGGCVQSFRAVYEDQVLFNKICLAYPVYVSDRCWDWYRQHPASSTVTYASRHAEYRRHYLNWLEQYLGEQHITDEAIWTALRREQVLLDDPTAFRWERLSATLRRRSRKLYRRILGWLGQVPEP
jgi:glycosyltransferase involved in cell wall biosynthesis